VKLFAQLLVTAVTALAVVPINHAWADYDAGVTAYQSGDFRQAMAEWLPLAEGGDAIAQNSVGALYDHGLGVDEDDIEAVRWYQMAADQGLPLAMRNLAGMYAGGYGVGFDKDQAIYWYDKAAQAGDRKAAERLSALDPSRATLPASEPTTEPMTVAGGEDDASMSDGGAAAAQEPQVAAAPEASAEPVAEPAPAPVPSAAPEAEAAAPSADMQYGEGSAAPAVQQASIATPPAAAGNWLIGQWEGPSLGCPPGGGLEFTSNETLSYFGGRVAASLQASYTVKGDVITVISTGVDGVGHTYEYRRAASDRFVIASVPSDMPANMVGVEYRRCGAAPTETAALPVAAPAPATAPATPAPAATGEPTPQPFVPSEPVAAAPAPAQPQPATTLTVPTVPTTTAAPAPSAAKLPAAPGTGGDAAQAGWDAFGRGDYQGALDVWKPVAEAGNTDMQILVGSIYDFGQGVPQDDAEAAKWYQMAAEKGSAKAQYQLGALYTRSPQARDPKKGYEWLTIAAQTIGTGNMGGITADQATTLAALAKMSLSDAEVKEAEAAAKAFVAKP
jgi:TPR repeat protein